MTTIRLGLSTCPNDTFLFGPLLERRVDRRGLDLDLHLADVEEPRSIFIRAYASETGTLEYIDAYVAFGFSGELRTPFARGVIDQGTLKITAFGTDLLKGRLDASGVVLLDDVSPRAFPRFAVSGRFSARFCAQP